MTVKKGIMKIEENVTMGEYVHAIMRNVDVIEKTEGNYKEYLVKSLSGTKTIYSGDTPVYEGGYGSDDNYTLYPNTTIDVIVGKYGDGATAYTWTEALATIS